MQPETLSAEDLAGFGEGLDSRASDKLGAHVFASGVSFAVWAPEASSASVIGSWNGWNADANPMQRIAETGVWHANVPTAREGDLYKYRLVSHVGQVDGGTGAVIEKADPYGTLQETPPCTASIVWRSAYAWRDAGWMKARASKDALDAPISIYELHLGSWRRVPEEGNRSLGYRELAVQLADYVARVGFTHVELMPVMEHPFYGSWGYQVTGYFAPSHRYGTPDDFRFLVDTLHQRGIGVILDWVPAHFPVDGHGLGRFDGSHLYEHADPRQGFHPEWKSFIFNYARNEVRSFLLSSALYWLGHFHIDGLRVDGVSSMLYLDYSRQPGEWIPNARGGRENLAAITFLKTLSETVYRDHPDVQLVAEEATSFPRVSAPTSTGGLGFGLKWDMGWMHDTLDYFATDPLYRQYQQNHLTFRSLYAYTENYVVPLSHDEVVYGKRSLLSKMPGDTWQKFANLRLLLAYMWAVPGKKLLFMGGEFGQWAEWNHDRSLDWHVLREDARHGQLAQLVGSLNHLYRSEPSLHEGDADSYGFEWLDGSNARESILAFMRKGRGTSSAMLVALNFTPETRHAYRIGVPEAGIWHEALNSDATVFGGSGQGNLGSVESRPIPCNGRRHSVSVTLPPLGALFLKAR